MSSHLTWFPDDTPCPTCGSPLGPGEGGWPDTPDGPRYCSAACAAAVAAARLRRADRKVTVMLPGGDLGIEWRERDDHVLMTGPVEYESEGRFDPALFAEAGAA